MDTKICYQTMKTTINFAKKIKIILSFFCINLLATNLLWAQGSYANDNSFITGKYYGGNGGSPFDNATVKSIAIAGDRYVDQIVINNVSHGGEGGRLSSQIVLADDEYISSFTIGCGSYIDYVQFVTNKGRSISTGGGGGQTYRVNNVRVLSIGGRSDRFVDRLEIKYVQNYKPSVLVALGVPCIISFNPKNSQIEEYVDQKTRTLDAYEKITEAMSRQSYSASVEAEFYVKASASTELEFKNTTTTHIKNEIEQNIDAGQKRTMKLGNNEVGVTVVASNIMRSSDGKYWIYPIAQPQYITKNYNSYSDFLNMYDLTYILYTQLSQLNQYKTMRHGFMYYDYNKK